MPSNSMELYGFTLLKGEENMCITSLGLF